jgi:hypothetical protein
MKRALPNSINPKPPRPSKPHVSTLRPEDCPAALSAVSLFLTQSLCLQYTCSISHVLVTAVCCWLLNTFSLERQESHKRGLRWDLAKTELEIVLKLCSQQLLEYQWHEQRHIPSLPCPLYVPGVPGVGSPTFGVPRKNMLSVC